MVNPINQNALLDLAMKAWDSTKQPLRSRATILPLGEYEDGSVHPAWPGLLAAPFEGMANFGRYGYDTPEAIADNARSAFDIAGGAMTGSLGVGLVRGLADNSVGVFGGRLAKTADHAALKRAEDLAASGAPRESIWDQTGWFQGVDGKWRFEIDDSQAALGQGEKFGQAMSHPGLFDAYPELANADFTFTRGSGGNYAHGGYNRFEDRTNPASITVGDAQNASTPTSVALHEGQHGIQSAEGFAQGGNPAGMAAPMNSRAAWQARLPAAIRSELDARGIDKLYEWDDAWPSIKESLRQRIEDDMGQPFSFRTLPGMDGLDEAGLALEQARINPAATLNEIAIKRLKDTGSDAYRRLAGETEARTVQKRQNLTADERRARPPWLDYDVPESDQIVRFNSSGPQASMTTGDLLYSNAKPGAAVPLMEAAMDQTALPMDLASRMARAREMGFDTDRVLYHGTDAAHLTDNEFKLNHGGGAADRIGRSGLTRDQIYFASDENHASKFGPEVGKYYIRGNFKDHNFEDSFIQWARELGYDNPQDAINKYYEGDIYEAMNVDDEMLRLALLAKEEGLDGVRATFGGLKGNGVSGDIVTVFDPKNIRSVNAAFDPAKSDSANLLAANAKTGAAVPLMEAALDQPQGIRAYHGSPHDFDKFDLSRIGTGEGWQGQGHGLYFGSVEPISTAYREQLTRNAPIKIGGRDMSPDARNIWANNGFDLDRAIAAVKQMEADAKASNRPFISSRAGQYASYRAELEAARAEGVPFPGHQYEVNIRANPNDFLDWATLDEATRARLNTPEGAKAAAEQGIPGIRYLDAMSRGAGEGSSNYVVFDDSLIDILRKYANAPTGAALPLAAEAQDVDPNDPVLLSVLRQYGMLN